MNRLLGIALLLALLGVTAMAEAPSRTDALPESTVYLTFDDGPAADTASILDILKSKGVHATFFINAFNRQASLSLIGHENNLLAYRDVLRRMVEEGHVIGNHTFSHRDLGSLTTAQIIWQLDTVQRDLDEALGPQAPRLTLIRPPFGSPWLGKWGTLAQRERVAAVVEVRGLVMNWTRACDSGDSASWVPGEAERLQDPTSRDILAQLIDDYRALGYEFDTLDHYAQWRWGPSVLGTFR